MSFDWLEVSPESAWLRIHFGKFQDRFGCAADKVKDVCVLCPCCCRAHSNFGNTYSIVIAWLPTFYNEYLGLDMKSSSWCSVSAREVYVNVMVEKRLA